MRKNHNVWERKERIQVQNKVTVMHIITYMVSNKKSNVYYFPASIDAFQKSEEVSRKIL